MNQGVTGHDVQEMSNLARYGEEKMKKPKKPKPRYASPNWGGKRPGAGAPKKIVKGIPNAEVMKTMMRMGKALATRPDRRPKGFAPPQPDDGDLSHLSDAELDQIIAEKFREIGHASPQAPTAAPASPLEPSRLPTEPESHQNLCRTRQSPRLCHSWRRCRALHVSQRCGH